MSYKYWRIFATFLLALGLMAACSSQPVNNPSNLIPVKTNVQALTLGEINTTIVDACRSRGWVPTAINQGIVQCNITVRGRHKALVNIHCQASQNLCLIIRKNIVMFLLISKHLVRLS